MKEELNFVDKLNEKNSQISNVSKDSFDYELTDAMKEKSHIIYNTLNEDQLKKFVVLNFQKLIILDDEEDNNFHRKASNSKTLIKEDSSLEDNKKEKEINSMNIDEIKNDGLNEKKKIFDKITENQSANTKQILSELKRHEKNTYFHLNKKFIYSELEKNNNISICLNSELDNSQNTIYVSNHYQSSNISTSLKSLYYSTSQKEKNNNNENNNNNNNLKDFSLINNINQNLYTNKKYYNNDSLYNLLNSECFDMNLVMYYLSIKDESTIIDVLVNIIYSKCIDQSLFYIPQLCFLISNKKFYESIENYILDTCVDQIKFSLIGHWLLNSFIQHDDEKVMKKFDKFIQRIEMTLVNGRRATLSNYRMFNSLNKKSEEDVVLNSLDKDFRLQYFDKINRFYIDLKSMCEKLKNYPKEDKVNENLTRKGKLTSYLKRFNKKLTHLFEKIIEQKNMYPNSLRKNKSNSTNEVNINLENKTSKEIEEQMLIDEKILNFKFSSKSLNLFRGYILPFDDNTSTIDEYNTLIVNFLPEYSFCFSTKARVPVKITVETIKLLEAEFWDDLIINDEEMEFNNCNKEQDDGKSVNSRISQLNDGKK